MKSRKMISKKPVPSVKGATQEMLCRVASWMETAGAAETVIYGEGVHTKEEWVVLQEARVLAVAYVRNGARQG